jgi:putative aminopeptidase FrvX
MTSQKNYIKTALRLPPHLHKELLDAADKNGRSLNAEILSRLGTIATQATLEELSRQTAEIRSMTREILETVNSK